MICWYFSGAALMPKLNLLFRKVPSSVTKTVMPLELLSNSIWWKPQSSEVWKIPYSHLDSLVPPSTVAIGNLSSTLTSLALVMSIHRWMSPAGFGMTTAGPLYSFGDVIRKEFLNLRCYVILNRERNSSYLLNNWCHLRINMKLQPVILQLTNPTKHPGKLSFFIVLCNWTGCFIYL